MTNEIGDATRHPSGLELALQWAQLPSEHLEVALKALEPQLVREHEHNMEVLRLQTQEADARRSHILYLIGLVAGFVLCAGSIAGAVTVGLAGHEWLAAMLSGPSILALATLFVLRRTDNAQTRAVAQAQRQALTALGQLPPLQ
ncbi:hypothetical protein ABZ479_19740 [Streptomyces sp. NPDC005722]